MIDGVSDSVLLAFLGLAGGVALGLASRLGRFCTLGAIEDAQYADDRDRLRMWALAIAVAILGVAALSATGALAVEASLYARTAWNPLASIIGGLVFGYGMALCGNCGFGALARAGGGDLRSLVILMVMAVAAYVVLNGPLSDLRLALFPIEKLEPGATAPTLTAWAAGFGVAPAVVVGVVGAGFAGWALSAARFRSSARHVFWSLVVGLAIIAGWACTGVVAAQSFDPIATESHTFTAPLGETLLFLMTSSGGGWNFAVGSVAGVALGGLLGAALQRSFRLEACDDPRELGRQMWGAALMGAGGVVALGCSIGQGLTAFSALAISAPVTLAAIYAGAALGLRQLIEGSILPFAGAPARDR